MEPIPHSSTGAPQASPGGRVAPPERKEEEDRGKSARSDDEDDNRHHPPIVSGECSQSAGRDAFCPRAQSGRPARALSAQRIEGVRRSDSYRPQMPKQENCEPLEVMS